MASLFIGYNVYAVPAAPSPICEITAVVSGLEKTRTNTEKPDIKGPNGITMAGEGRKNFDYYKVNLNILSISTYGQIEYEQKDDLSCNYSYIKRAEQSGQTLTLTEYNKNPILIGQKIKAKINFSGDEWFSGYFLSDIQLLENIITPKGLIPLIFIIIILLVIIIYVLLKNSNNQ